MITYEAIRKTLDAADLHIVETHDRWVKFDYCGLTIHIWNQNGTPQAQYDPDGAINVYSDDETFLDELRNDKKMFFHDFCGFGTKRISIDTCEVSDEEILAHLEKIQRHCWLKPRKMVNTLVGKKALAFAEHPEFFMFENGGYLYFIDAKTRKAFWKTSTEVSNEFHANGYAKTVTRSGAVYETELA